jgi:hypothetical protein
MLYGAFVFVRIWISGGCARAMPSLRGAGEDCVRRVWRKKKDAPDPCEPKAFAQRLHDTNVRIFSDKRYGTTAWFGEVDVSFIYDHDAFERFIIKYRPKRYQRDEGSGGVSGRTQEYEFNRWIGIDGFFYLWKWFN